MKAKRRRHGRRARAREALLRIEDIALTGEGIARLDGKAVFLPQTLMGEQVRARVHTETKVWRGDVLELVEASSERVEPGCAHAALCGGCNWIHMKREERERLHRHLVAQSLGSVVRLDPGSLTYHRPTEEKGYRTRARWQLSAPERVGFLRSRSKKLVMIERCEVLDPALATMPELLRQLIATCSGQGEAQTAMGAEGLPVLDLNWTGEIGVETFALAAAWVEQKRFEGIRIWPEGARSPSQWGDPRPWVKSAEGHGIHVAPRGFSQASQAGGALLAERVATLLGPVSGRLVELFAGSGTLTMALAACLEGERASLLAVESSADAAEQLRENLRLKAIDRAKVKVADANAFQLPRPLRAVVLDPPRAGAAGSCQHIAAARPRRVVYVSCNPATLARDLVALKEAGYRIAAVELFDLFAQTSHVETVVLLER